MFINPPGGFLVAFNLQLTRARPEMHALNTSKSLDNYVNHVFYPPDASHRCGITLERVNLSHPLFLALLRLMYIVLITFAFSALSHSHYLSLSVSHSAVI